MAVNLNDPRRADARGWGPGWPNCQSGKSVELEVLSLEGHIIRFPAHRISSEEGQLVFTEEVGFPGGVRSEIAELVGMLLRVSELRGFINLQPGWCWGGACRAIKRSDGTLTSTPSNHSWYLALDLNAPENGFGASTHTIPVAMARLWNEYGFRWGGDYSGTPDWMHFEFMGTPADAKAMTERARRLLQPEIEEADMTPEQEAAVKKAAAFIDTLTDELRPGRDAATVGGAAKRVAAVVLKVEKQTTP
jgi:hypothetical protein